jgi:hypothetical protein
MATVVAGFLSPWPLGWISATPRPLGVDRGHPQWPDLCIFFFFLFSFFFFLLVLWFAGERDMATEGGRISPPGRWGGSRPPPGRWEWIAATPSGRIYVFFFFPLLVRWFAGERDMATEGGQISPPGRWGGSRPPPVAGSIFFFFLVRWKCRWRWAVGGDAISRRWAVDFFVCLIC